MLVESFISAMIILGVAASYSDIRYGKIKNAWIVLGIIAAVAIYSSIFIAYRDTVSLSPFYTKALINAALALLIGFLLWYFGLWTAGDAKLFFVFALLIAPILAIKFHSFSLLDFLINIFVPLGIYL